MLELEDVSAVSDFDATGFLKPGENILHPIDDVWINKFEFVKEKVMLVIKLKKFNFACLVAEWTE